MALQDRLHSASEDAHRQGHTPDLGQASGLFGQRPRHLDHKEGITLGFTLQQCDYLWLLPSRSEHRRAEASDLLRREPAELQYLRSRQSRGQVGPFVVAIAPQHQQRCIRRPQHSMQRIQAFIPSSRRCRRKNSLGA